MEKIIYLDTNIFLHYQPFDQINWLKVVQADSVTIVIPPITIRELNKHKDSHHRAQIKQRAGDTIKTLTRLINSGTNASLRENVHLVFEDRDPNIDFATHQLNNNVQDDHLIASIIFRLKEFPTNQITLVTSDLGLTLVAKAGRQKINTLRMPDNFRIADEPDASELQIKNLKQQVHELTTRIPILSLSYEDGAQHQKFRLSKPIILDQAYTNKTLEEIKNKFPKRENPKREKDKPKERSDLVGVEALLSTLSAGGISKAEIDRYNNEVDSYVEKYSKFIAKQVGYENLQRRTIRLDLRLINDGTTPAEDIDIFLHFPDGFRLLAEHELSSPPTPPNEPVKPMTEMERLNHLMNRSHVYSNMLPYSSYVPNSIDQPSNVSGPDIKRTNSYNVDFHVGKIKHKLEIPLDPLFVVFESYDVSNSFKIEYSILAANIADEVLGELHVIIEKM